MTVVPVFSLRAIYLVLDLRILPNGTKLALGVCHPPDAASQMSLLSTISIFFDNNYMSLSQFLFPLSMMLVGSLENVSEFFKPSNFFLCSRFLIFVMHL